MSALFPQLVFFTLPLIALLGHLLDLRRKHGDHVNQRHVITVLAPSALLLIFTVYLGVKEFPSAYGTTALVLGPLRTGNIVLLVSVFGFVFLGVFIWVVILD